VKLRWIDIVASYLIYLALFGLSIMAGLHSTLSYVALYLSFVCSVLWFVARWQLGDAFSVTPQARLLVTRGLYSKIRHPVYVFGSLAFLFGVLALQVWPALIIWVVLMLIQVIRVRREERVLAETFGAEYTVYRSRTWF
jgi:protein-S-isoprenylcysteine O-methyltransferase Ste14